MLKCDCCNRFGDDIETFTVEIKKHKGCDINVLFGAWVDPLKTYQPSPSPIPNPMPLGGTTVNSIESELAKIREVNA